METVLFASFLTQYDAIKASFKEMKPFLNINEEMRLCYRLIFVLKIQFVVHAFVRAVGKYLSSIFKQNEKLCNVCNHQVFTDFLPRVLSIFVMLSFYEEPLLLVSGEFLTDICVLIFSLYYAAEAYGKELEKLSSVTFMCLFVQWFLNHTANIGQFELGSYFQVSTLLGLSYFPVRPNNANYRRMLAYLYLVLLIYIWIVYNIGQDYNRHHYVMHQNIIKGSRREELHTTLEPVRGNLDDTLQNFDVNRGNICLDAKNIQNSIDAPQEVVPSKAAFPRNREQSITENLERVCKPASFGKIIQNEDTRKTIKCDISDGKEVNEDGKNSDRRTLDVPDVKQHQPSVLPQSSVYEEPESVLDEPNNAQSTFKDDKIHKNISEAENAQSEEIVEEPTRDVNFEQEEKKILNGKSKIQILKRHGEISKGAASNMKASEPGSKVGSNDLTIQKSTRSKNKSLLIIGSKIGSKDIVTQKSIHSKNKSRVILSSGVQGLTGGNATNIVHMGKVSRLKIANNDNDGKGLQVKNSGGGKQGRIKPAKVPIVKSARKLLRSKMSKPIVKGRDKSKKKEILAIGNNGPSSKSEVSG